MRVPGKEKLKMRFKGFIILGLCIIFLVGCAKGTENMNEDTVEQIKDFLMSQYEFGSENAVKGAAARLNSVGCGKPAGSVLVEDEDEVYVIELTDEKGNIFCFNIEHQGYIGPILNGDGDYLYTPID